MTGRRAVSARARRRAARSLRAASSRSGIVKGLLALGAAVFVAIAAWLVAGPSPSADQRSSSRGPSDPEAVAPVSAETADTQPKRQPRLTEPEPVVPEPVLLPAESTRSEPDGSTQSAGKTPVPDAGSPDPQSPSASPQTPETPESVEALEAEAFAVVERLTRDFPGETDPIGMMGMLHNRLDDTAEAVKCWQQCLERDPRRADAYGAMGMIALRKQEYQEAADLMRKALGLDPALRGARHVLADALISLGRSQEAVAVLREQVEVSPENSRTFCMLGKAHRQLGEYPEARESYLQAIELDSNCTKAYYGLATALARLGHTDQARQYTEKFRQLKSREDTAHRGRRAEYTDMTWARRVLVLTHTEAGRVYLGHGFLWKAEQHLEKAADLDPTDVACRKELAPLYERTDQHRRAVEVCEQLRGIDPKDAQLHALAGALYTQIGEIDAARDAVRHALELDPDNASYRRLDQRIQEAP